MKRWVALGIGCVAGIVAPLLSLNALADEVFLTEAQAPVALFGAGAVGDLQPLMLTGSELQTLSHRVQKRVEKADYRTLEVKDKDGAALGLIVEVDVVGQSLPIQFAVGVRADGSLQDIQVMVYREPHGQEIEERRFRAQFRGKTENDPLVVGKDIDAISGATISSASAAYAARKGLALAAIVSARRRTASAQR